MKKAARKSTDKSSILLRALSKDLEKMSTSARVRSLKDGKDYVCPFCELPVKPCKTRSSAMCEYMLLEGTEGKNIEEALKDAGQTVYGRCVACGRRLTSVHLKKHPTAEVCSLCAKKSRKVKSTHLARA